MNVEELMTRSVRTCSPNESLECAARAMWETDCGVVPIVDGEGKAVGMLTDRDICMAAYTQGRPLFEIPVSSAASKNLFSVRANESVQVAEQMMRTRQVHRLAVTDGGGKLIGLLSLGDIARHAGRRTKDLTLDDVGKTLSAISQPHVVSHERSSASSAQPTA